MMDSIDTLEAGRELDALVAEKVMGWRRKSDSYQGGMYHIWTPPESDPLYDADWDEGYELPKYSTDIAAAWQVVEKMRERARSSIGAETKAGYLELVCRGADWVATFDGAPIIFPKDGDPYHSDLYIDPDWFEDSFLREPPDENMIGDPRLIAVADSAPLAICYAALKVFN